MPGNRFLGSQGIAAWKGNRGLSNKEQLILFMFTFSEREKVRLYETGSEDRKGCVGEHLKMAMVTVLICGFVFCGFSYVQSTTVQKY